MSHDLLTPLRELEPTPEEIARARRGAAEPPPARRARPALAIGAVAAAGAFTVVAALPGAENATSALRAAAASAADDPAPAGFSGYRYADVIDRRRDTWATMDEDCMRRHDLPKPARPVPRGGRAAPEPSPCPVTARVTYTEEGRQEIWVDSAWSGTVRDHGSRIVSTEGDPQLGSALRRETGRDPGTRDYVYGEGPFAHAPLPELPTDPDALLRTLSAAYEDGRWASSGKLEGVEPSVSRIELARYVAHLLAEANATPALRSAAFGVLARMDGVTDLGEIEDARGRTGHGIEIRGGTFDPGSQGTVEARLRVIFDPEQGELLSWADHRGDRYVERILLRTDQVRERP